MSRQAVIVLAFLALALVLAGPVCDAFDSHVGMAEGVCCAELADTQLVASAAHALPSFEAPLPILPGATGPTAFRQASSPSSFRSRGDPPVSRPYHARTARALL